MERDLLLQLLETFGGNPCVGMKAWPAWPWMGLPKKQDIAPYGVGGGVVQ